MAMLTSVLVAVFVALASSSSPSRWRAKCPCWPYGNAKDIVCDDSSLKSIPHCVTTDITSLSIQTPTIPLVAKTFERFTNLPRLQIQFLDQPEIAKDMLKHLRNLESFQIYSTGVDYIDNEWFLYSPHIKAAELYYNKKLTYLAPDTFIYLPMLRVVYLDNNNLTSLSPEIFEGTDLKTLYLEKNPWHCDCEMAYFIQWTREKKVKIEDNPRCQQPQRLRGMSLKDLTPSHTCFWKYDTDY